MAERNKRSINDSLKKKKKKRERKHAHNDNWTIKTKGRSFEYHKSISHLTILLPFFFNFSSWQDKESNIKNLRLSTMQEKRGASRQTNK